MDNNDKFLGFPATKNFTKLTKAYTFGWLKLHKKDGGFLARTPSLAFEY